MQRTGLMQRFRNAAWKAWLGAALAACLLLAESFALAHELDRAAHDSGQACAVCVGAASFGAAAAPVPFSFEAAVGEVSIAVALFAVFVSVAPTRRYARGPPAVSF